MAGAILVKRFKKGERHQARLSRGSAGVFGCLAAATACTELASGSDRLEQTAASNLPDAGGTADSRWACLEGPAEPSAVALRSEAVLTLALTDIGSAAPPVGLVARACIRLDVDCQTPVGPNVAVGDDGALHLPVPRGFDGFVELTSDVSVPTMYFISQPLLTDRREAFRILNPMILQALAAQGGVTIDALLGHVIIRAFDCQGAAASGVEFSNNRGGVPFSFVNGLPNVGANVTTDEGLGGFVNVPPGLVVLQGREVDAGRTSGTVSVSVRPGWFTYGDVEPR